MIHPIARLIEKIQGVSIEASEKLSSFILLQTIKMNHDQITEEEADKEIRSYIYNIIKKAWDGPEAEEVRKEFDEWIKRGVLSARAESNLNSKNKKGSNEARAY